LKNRLRRPLRAAIRSGAIFPICVLLLWQYGTLSGWWNEFLLPGPFAVLKSFFSLSASGELVRNIASSLSRIFKGFFISAFFALSAALACGLYRPLLRQLSPSLNFLRHIPPMAAIPMLILWFGIGETSKLAIIILATFFPIFLNTSQGISQCDPDLLEVARAFGYNRLQTLFRVVLPSALPYILTGMRLGLGYSWRSLIGAELLAASSGLGYMILNAEQLARPDVIMTGILVIGGLGSAMDALFSLAAEKMSFCGSRGGADGLV
jgi:sulfonate transport system permease protein